MPETDMKLSKKGKEKKKEEKKKHTLTVHLEDDVLEHVEKYVAYYEDLL